MCPYCGGEETHHADTEVYNLNAGQQARALSETRITLPAAFGSMTARIANLEFATFDEQDFPFWVPVSGVMSTRRVARSPIPEFAVPRWREAHGAGLEELGPLRTVLRCIRGRGLRSRLLRGLIWLLPWTGFCALGAGRVPSAESVSDRLG